MGYLSGATSGACAVQCSKVRASVLVIKVSCNRHSLLSYELQRVSALIDEVWEHV